MSIDEKKSILIVDDDVTIRKLISFQLKHNGFIPYEAKSPDEGFQILKGNEINLVLCDVTMDGMDGFTFCEKVRENQEHRFLPFVFVTAKNTLEDKNRAMEVGGDDIISKPFDVKELLIKIKALLRRTEIYKIYGVKNSLNKAFSSGKTEILLVDDDSTLIKLFYHNFVEAGFDCRTASSVEEAFNKLKDKIPDVIISDIMMPAKDGITFRKEIMENDEYRKIPFIFLTSKSSEVDILNGYRLGITDYVVKSSGPKVIVAKVSSLIQSLTKERTRIVTELNAAVNSMRVKVVPDKSPKFKGFEIRQWHKPFQGIPGGDFIDYYKLDDNNLAVVLGDVMGKKWGAWYFAFAYAGYVRSSLRGVLQNAENYSPSEILEKVNKSVYEDASVAEVFSTISIIIINNKDNIIRYAGAGDLPLIYKNSATGEVKNIKSDGTLLGFSLNGNFSDQTIHLNNNDFVLLLTDGVIESRNANKEMFGSGGLTNLVEKMDGQEDIVGYIQKDVAEFTNENFEDDISLISVKAN